MAAETADQTSDLSKVDSAISGLSSSPTEEKKFGHRRTSSSVPGVYNINDLGEWILQPRTSYTRPSLSIAASLLVVLGKLTGI